MSTNGDALKAYYYTNIPKVFKQLTDYIKRNELSGPWLIDLDAHDYFDAPKKLMFIGQQANGWGSCLKYIPGDKKRVDYLLDQYKEFNLGHGYSTALWKAYHRIYRSVCGLSENSKLGFIATNINKIDENGGRPENEKLVSALESIDEMLVKEIELASPDAIVLFTGPYYARRINQQLKGYKSSPDYPSQADSICLIEHDNLPCKTYLTYHPQYLMRSNLFDPVLDKMCELILKET